MFYVVHLTDAGTDTVATYDEPLGYREAISRAIEEGKLVKPGRYLIANPHGGLLNGYSLTVEQSLRVKP